MYTILDNGKNLCHVTRLLTDLKWRWTWRLQERRCTFSSGRRIYRVMLHTQKIRKKTFLIVYLDADWHDEEKKDEDTKWMRDIMKHTIKRYTRWEQTQDVSSSQPPPYPQAAHHGCKFRALRDKVSESSNDWLDETRLECIIPDTDYTLDVQMNSWTILVWRLLVVVAIKPRTSFSTFYLVLTLLMKWQYKNAVKRGPPIGEFDRR